MWRVQEERKDEKWKKRKKKKNKKKKKKRKWWKKCKEIIMSLSMTRLKKGKNEKESKRSVRRPKAWQTFGEGWEVAPSPSDFWGRIGRASRQCCSRRTTEKDGAGDEDAAGSAG